MWRAPCKHLHTCRGAHNNLDRRGRWETHVVSSHTHRQPITLSVCRAAHSILPPPHLPFANNNGGRNDVFMGRTRVNKRVMCMHMCTVCCVCLSTHRSNPISYILRAQTAAVLTFAHAHQSAIARAHRSGLIRPQYAHTKHTQNTHSHKHTHRPETGVAIIQISQKHIKTYMREHIEQSAQTFTT